MSSSPSTSRARRTSAADISEVLELFDRRYRDVRGEDDSYSLQDPDYPQGPLDQL